MDDMPETIAAWRFLPEKADEWVHGGWSDDHDHKTVAYTRTDRANELVAAAYEAAALECERAAYSGEYPQNDAIELGCLRSRDFIRRLTPADAVAALAARDARIREAALREAYVNLKTYRPHEVDGPEHDVGYTAGYVTAMSRVEALIAKDKANG